jgi:hypothetical protein
MNHLDLIREHCAGQQWDEAPFATQDEILSQYLRDEGFDVLVAGCPEHRMQHVFRDLLADMLEKRSAPVADFAAAGRAFAAAAYSLARAEAEFVVEQLWDDARDDYWAEHGDPDAHYLLSVDGRARLEGVQ